MYMLYSDCMLQSKVKNIHLSVHVSSSLKEA